MSSGCTGILEDAKPEPFMRTKQSLPRVESRNGNVVLGTDFPYSKNSAEVIVQNSYYEE